MKFSIAGTGNVAHHFATMWQGQGHSLLQVYARQAEAGQRFAQQFGGHYISDAALFTAENDIVLVAVKDDAIAEVAANIPLQLYTLHPSGSTSISALPQVSKGVAWGIQSMSLHKALDYSKIPFLIEANNKPAEDILMQLFSSISNQVHVATSEQRARVHMAAVFANNFTNQMYDVAEGILSDMHLPMEILLPSIEEQVSKIKVMKPRAAQTGPAARADMATLQRHLNFLNDTPELKEIYTQLTNRILRIYHGKKL
jgi:predicted short-subunit dehydrogenase-like oxidoreductase (DUF2520 family)